MGGYILMATEFAGITTHLVYGSLATCTGDELWPEGLGIVRECDMAHLEGCTSKCSFRQSMLRSWCHFTS